MIYKLFFTLLLSFYSFTSFSQSNNETTIKKIKLFINQYSVDPETNKIGKKAIIYYNKVDRILDIDNRLVPLLEVKTTYYFSKEFNKHCVTFHCKENDCVSTPNEGYVRGFSIPFMNKQKCYELIELISQLKK